MRSAPQAMAWSFWRRGRWNLILGFLGANALATLLFAALRHDGALERDDSNQILMSVILLQTNLFIFTIAVIAALGPASRLSALPISTQAIVGWHFLLGIMALFAETVLSSALVNWAFDLGWPLWGPALFAAASFAVVQAVLWLFDRSGWVVVALSVVVAPLGIWFKSRFGPPFAPPNHYWSAVTPIEVMTLLAIVALAYGTAVVGVSRNRCGQPSFSLGFLDWLNRLFDRPATQGLPFRSPTDAQRWLEWRKKGWAMPGVVVMGQIMGFGMWLLVSRDAAALWIGVIASGGIFAMAGLMGGLILGNVGRNDTDLQFGHFLATRPITSTEMGRTLLTTVATSLVIAWSIWLASISALVGVWWALGINAPHPLPEPFGWWYFPATLLGAWTTIGMVMPLVLTGRVALVGGLFLGSLCLTCVVSFFSRGYLSQQAQMELGRSLLVTAGVVFVLGTGWAFLAARRRTLIAWRTPYIAASVWAVLLAFVLVLGQARAVRLPVPGSIALMGLLALTVAPLATTPLALAWNRNR